MSSTTIIFVSPRLGGAGLAQGPHGELICRALPIHPYAYREHLAKRRDPSRLTAIGAASISRASTEDGVQRRNRRVGDRHGNRAYQGSVVVSAVVPVLHSSTSSTCL